MQVIHFTILINADKKKVWRTMLDKNTYPLWTKEFGEGSDYIGNWTKGSEIRFIALDKEGQAQGMFSKIKDNKEYEFISIQHLGMITNGVVDTTSEEVRKWLRHWKLCFNLLEEVVQKHCALRKRDNASDFRFLNE